MNISIETRITHKIGEADQEVTHSTVFEDVPADAIARAIHNSHQEALKAFSYFYETEETVEIESGEPMSALNSPKIIDSDSPEPMAPTQTPQEPTAVEDFFKT